MFDVRNVTDRNRKQPGVPGCNCSDNGLQHNEAEITKLVKLAMMMAKSRVGTGNLCGAAGVSLRISCTALSALASWQAMMPTIATIPALVGRLRSGDSLKNCAPCLLTFNRPGAQWLM